MLHGFGSFPGSPWSLSTPKSTGLEPMPLSNQTPGFGVRGSYRTNVSNFKYAAPLAFGGGMTSNW